MVALPGEYLGAGLLKNRTCVGNDRSIMELRNLKLNNNVVDLS
jgi:hypothetical protein